MINDRNNINKTSYLHTAVIHDEYAYIRPSGMCDRQGTRRETEKTIVTCIYASASLVLIKTLFI